jgi:hypothetical protein
VSREGWLIIVGDIVNHIGEQESSSVCGIVQGWKCKSQIKLPKCGTLFFAGDLEEATQISMAGWGFA